MHLPWALCQAAVPQMLQRGGGVIINITSVHEEIPGKGVNNIAPGMIATL